MGKVFRSVIIAIMIMVCSFGFVACGETPPAEFTIRFIVNDEEYHTLSTSGNTVIRMPEDPTMEEYDFVGWYWDKYIWEKPFTVNSLLHTPLSSNMEVHARFVLKHNHNLEHKEYKAATCGEFGNEEYWQCTTCSKMYDDAYGIREIFNIPTLTKLAHTKGDWEIAVPATCEETGLKHRCCTSCGAALEVEEVPTTGHAYTNWVTTVEPTYTTMGTEIRGCEHCTYSESRDIPMLTVIASKPENLTVDHGVLRWEGESTFGFEVIVNGAAFTTTDNFFEPEFIADDYNSVQVAAIGLNDTRSEYVELANFVVNQPISNLHFTDDGEMVTFTWDSPSDLYDYVVTINETETTVSKYLNSYSVASNTCSVGDEISIYVQGVANANFYPSKKQTITLNAIDAPVVSISGLNVVWDAVTDACSYKVVGDTTFVSASGMYAFGCEGLASGVHTLAVSAFGVDHLSSTTTFTFNKLVAPAVSISGDTLSWPAVAGQIKYTVIDDGQEYSITGQSYTLSSATADFDVYLYAASMQPNTMQSDIVVVSKFSCDEYSTYYHGFVDSNIVCYTDIIGDVLYVPNSIMHEVDFSGIEKNVTLVASRVPYTLNKDVVTGIIVPSNITAIPMAAFENCVNATSATISNSVTSIATNIFTGCTALANITIPYVGDGADNAFFGYIFGATNYSNQYGAIPYTLKTVVVTGGTSIADNAFYDCEYIESVSLPEGLETIGSEVFQDCFALSTINIPSTITNIGSSAFNCCTNMSRVNITNLNAWFNISFEDVSSNPLLDGKLYLNGTLIENLVIPKEITCIKNYAFNSASQLKTVTFEEGSSCTTIGVESFGWCKNLESIALPNSLTTIGSVAFGSCNKLTTIVIPNSVTSIGYGAFDDCNALQSITLPFIGNGSNKTHFGYIFGAEESPMQDFDVPASLKEVNFTAVTVVTSHAFECCSNIEKITFADGLLTIEPYAFFHAYKLNNISLPNTLTSIGEDAFDGNASLTSFVIPNSVTSLGDRILYGCTGIETISMPLIDSIANSSWASYLFGTYVPAIKTVHITQGTYIANSMFYGYGAIETITLPEGITSIGYSAFERCSALKSINIPSTVTSIDEDAFWTTRAFNMHITDVAKYCQINFGNINSNYFYMGAKLYLNGTLVENLVIPKETTKISAYAFHAATQLKTISFEADSVCTSIGDSAFYNCYNVSNINIPNTVTTIESKAFVRCSSLTSIVIPNSVTSLGAGILENCATLEKLTIPFVGSGTSDQPYLAYIFSVSQNTNNEAAVPSCLKELTITGSKSIHPYALNNCHYIEEITLSDNISGIGHYAFAGCIALKYINIPSTLTSLSSYIFSGCTSLENVVIPENVTTIGVSAFHGCSSLTDINIPSAVTSIANDAFYDCTGIEKVYITDMTAWLAVEFGNEYSNPLCYGAQLYLNDASVEHIVISKDVLAISDNQFKNNTQIKTVTFEEGSMCTSIGNYAFLGCTNLESITLPSTITSIGTEAFRNCKKLAGINLPNGLLTIGDNAFDKCQALTTVVVPNSVTSIGVGAFDYCTALTSITIPFVGGGTSEYTNFGYIFGSSAYNAQNSVIPTTLKTITITGGTAIADYAFLGCLNIETITLPEGLTSIGANAFYGCNSLESVNIPTTVIVIGLDAFFDTCPKTYITDLTRWLSIDLASPASSPLYGGSDDLYLNDAIIENLVIPKEVTAVKQYVFNGTSVKTVSFESGSACTTIGNYAFSGCSGLTNIVIPNSVTSIGSGAFEYCISLETLSFPIVSNVKYFAHMFGGDDNLVTSYEYIPNSLKTINITKGTEIPNSFCAFFPHEATITLPAELTTIGEYAFYNYGSLTNIEIPSGLISIGNYAFGGCLGLTSVVVPNSVTSIGIGAFSGCNALASITLPFTGDGTASNTHFGYIFGAETTVENNRYVPANLKTVTITRGTTIANSAFWQCENITTINLPIISIIGTEAFYDCSQLTKIILLQGLSSIGASAFEGCSSLSIINIPQSVVSIGSYAFKGNGLTRVYITDLTAWCNISFTDEKANPLYNGASLYLNGTLVEDLVIPQAVTSIKDFAFYNADQLKSVTFETGSACVSIGYMAFAYCNSITSASIPNSVSMLDDSAFAYCTSLVMIIIPDSVTSIGIGIVEGCSSLVSITIPFVGDGTNFEFFGTIFGSEDATTQNNKLYDSLTTVFITNTTTIGGYAFYGCENIENIILPNGLTIIGDRAFEACSALSSINIPSTVNTIGEYTFANCSSLIIVNIPSSVTSIGAGVFENCYNLEGVVLSEGLTTIGNYAFYGCSDLTNIVVPNSVTSIGLGAFYACEGLESITLPFTGRNIDEDTHLGYIFGTIEAYESADYVPNSLKTVIITGGTAIHDCAFYGCENIENIILPNGITTIGSDAFGGCSSLKTINIPSTVTHIAYYAFSCENLERVDITDLTAWCNITVDDENAHPATIGTNLYLNGNLVENLLIPKEVTTIKNYVFSSFGIKSLAFEDNSLCTSIGIEAFAGCSSLTTISWPNNILTIDTFAFACCESLYLEAVPSSVTSVGEGAFYGCTSLTSMLIPNNVTYIGNYAFANCSALNNISLPFTGDGTGSSTYFGYIFGASDAYESADYVPNSLKAVTITGGTAIHDFAFYGCENIEIISLPVGITTIGEGAFYNCSALTTINIPSTVTSIGEYAFEYCTSLERINITDFTAWCNITFDNEYANPLYYGAKLYLNGELVEDIVISNTVTSIADNAFENMTQIKTVTFEAGSKCTTIGNYAFKGCSNLTSIVIPSSVTSIGLGAFYACDVLESITLPFVGDGTYTNPQFGYIFGAEVYEANSILVPTSLKNVTITGGTAINYCTFYGCENIENIILPNGITTIGNSAFYDCSSLTTINIPSSVTSMDALAFVNCTGLARIDITDLAAWCNIGFGNEPSNPLFYGAKLYLNGELIEDLVIPNTVTVIKTNAFLKGTQFKTLSFEEGSVCVTINSGAFGGCSGLTSVIIPNSVTSISTWSFDGCNKIESLTIPSLYGSWIGAVFGNTSWEDTTTPVPASLKTVTITGGTTIEDYAFYNCSNLTTVNVPSTVTYIGEYAFDGCESLTNIVLPEGVTTIDMYAFANCSSLTTINIPSTVTAIYGNAFTSTDNLSRVDITDLTAWCNITFDDYTSNPLNTGAKLYLNGLLVENLVIPKEVTAVKQYAFYGATQLKSVSFESGSVCTTIGEESFDTCRNLTTISLPNSLTQINDYSFFRCVGLTNVVIPNGVTSIGFGTFDGCSGMTSVSLPSSLKTISTFAFVNCTSLTSIVVPDSVTSIGIGIVEGCSSLVSITLPFVGDGNVNTYFGYIFDTEGYQNQGESIPSSLKTVTITGGTSIADYAFYGCNNIERIILPEGLETIGVKSFEFCSALSRINIPSTVTSVGACAFQNYSERLTRIDIVDIAAWCNISFADECATPVVPVVGKVYLNGTILTDLVIPNEVTTIKSLVFWGFNIETLSFEEGSQCTTIEPMAFAGCYALTNISLPTSLVEIHYGAFAYCVSLPEVVVPNSVTSIAIGAFAYCESLTSISLPFTGNGDDETQFGYIFSAEEDNYSATWVPESLKTVTITNGTVLGMDAFVACSNIETINLPDGLERIEPNALSCCENLQNIVIPSTVTFIGESAFGGCKSLTSINIPSSVTTIIAGAFYQCIKLTSIVIPNSVTSIGWCAFEGCVSLESITLPFVGDGDDSSYFGYIFGSLCGEDNDIYVPYTLTSVTITGGTSIADYAFYGCEYIENIILPEGLTTIGDSAFEGCTNLSSIVIPNSVESIGYSAFAYCDSLESITLPFTGNGSNQTHFGYIFGAPDYEENPNYVPATLKTVTITGGTVIADSAFYECVYIETIVLPEGLITIDNYAFEWCAFTTIDIPSTVTTIGRSAFDCCCELTDIVLPNGLTTIGEYAFYNCYSLTNIVVPNSVTSIGDSAFYRCDALTSISLPFVGDGTSSNTHFGYIFGAIDYEENADYVPASLKTVTITGGSCISEYAFCGCQNIETIVLPEGLAEIGPTAFNVCSNLTIINIPSTVTYIAYDAFMGCSKLATVNITDLTAWCSITFDNDLGHPFIATPAKMYVNDVMVENLVIPKEVRSVKFNAFAGLDQLKTVTFESGSVCSTIGESAFGGCSNLSSVIMPNSVTSINLYAFMHCNKLTDIVIPNSVIRIGENAFAYCEKLTIITVPNSVTSIGLSVFEGCSSLASITIPFVGDGTSSNTHFGYIFGATSFYQNGTCVPASLKTVTITGGTFVDDDAFCFCENIKTVVLPEGLIGIGATAFQDCFALSTINIPSTVTYIDGGAFNSVGITRVDIKDLTKWCYITFDNIYSNPAMYGGGIYLNGELIEDLVIPKEVTYVNDYAFSYYTTLKSVSFETGSRCENIGISTFTDCIRVTSITLPNSLYWIDEYAFQNCIQLTSLVMPENVTYIGKGALQGCGALTSVSLPFVGDGEGETHFGYIFGADTYSGQNGYIPDTLKTVTIVNGGYIYEYAFAHCENIDRIILSGYIGWIGKHAFTDCHALTRISIPSTVTRIGAGAFMATPDLVRVDITDMNAWAAINFEDFESNPTNNNGKLYLNGELVEEIVLTEGITSIGSNVFTNLDIETITIPSTVTTIGECAFSDCTSLTEIVIPNSVTSIGEGAFAGCTAVENISIPFTGSGTGSNTTLGYLFGGADNSAVPSTLKTVTITGNGAIPDAAFADCGHIETIILADGTVTTNSVASSVKATAIRTGNTGITSIGEFAFYYCFGLKEVIIPNSVTSIGFSAFDGCSALESITLPFVGDGNSNSYFGYIFGANSYWQNSASVPSTLKTVSITNTASIANYAFYNCGNILELHLPEGLETIGAYAFENCNDINYINIPSTVTHIGNGAFSKSEWEFERYIVEIASWTSWCAITFGNENSNPFSVCSTVYVNGREVTNLVIPKEVTHISRLAFYMSPGIDKVSFESGSKCTSIGDYAFSNAEIESISLPEGLISIEAYAFEFCTDLTRINIPSTVTTIGEFAFNWCYNITRVDIVDIAAWCNITLEEVIGFEPGVATLYLNGRALTDLVIPKEVTAIKDAVFCCFNIETLSFEEGSQCTSIGIGAFAGCLSLTSVSLPNSITDIQLCAFYTCMALTDIDIPTSVATIGEAAFHGCAALTEIVIPSSVTSIGMAALGMCESLEYISTPLVGDGSEVGHCFAYMFITDDGEGDYNVIVPETLKTIVITGGIIEYNAFILCYNVETIILPEGITSIGQGAFEDCYALVDIVIPSSVTSIGDEAFSDCDSLTSITIPSSVTTIGNYAFEDCSSLTSIVVPDSVTSIGFGAFNDCDGLKSITLPFVGDGSSNEGNQHFGYIFGLNSYSDHWYNLPTTLTEVTITGGTTIYDNAFTRCNSIKKVHLPESVNTICAMAFAESGVEYLTIAGTLVEVDRQAFASANSLTTINITSVANWCNSTFERVHANPLYDGAKLYLNGVLIENLIIPSEVTTINSYVFYNANQIKTLTFEDSSTCASIGDSAFEGCTSLVRVNITDLDAWNAITFANDTANPLCYGAELYLNGEVVVEDPTTIVISKYVTSIANNKYSGNTNVTTVIFEEGSKCVSIGAGAFAGCTNLTNIVIPNSVTSIGFGAFEGCNSLQSISLPFIGDDGVGPFNTHFGYVFGANNSNSNDVYVPTTLKTVTITGGNTIESQAFRCCKNIETIVLSEGLLSIEGCAFYCCDGLTNINIPSTVTNIGEDAFLGGQPTRIDIVDLTQWCNFTFVSEDSTPVDPGYSTVYLNGNVLTDVIIPKEVTAIKDYTFLGFNMESVSFEAGSQCTSIGAHAFQECYTLASVSLPGGITEISEFAFLYCVALTDILIPNSVTSIGMGAFALCVALNEMVIPNGVTAIGDYVFQYCTGLTSVEIPNSVTSIGFSVFDNCTSLESITLPFVGDGTDTNTHFGYIFGAESYSKNMDKIPSTLKTVIITNATTIADYAFYGCGSLEYIELNNGVTSIGDSAFESCGLNGNTHTKIIIPSSVDYMGTDVFVDCTAIVYYEFTSAPDTWVNDWLGPTGVQEYWYSETKPTSGGKYWHYVDGVPTVW